MMCNDVASMELAGWHAMAMLQQSSMIGVDAMT
jgi:hypothetical protein